MFGGIGLIAAVIIYFAVTSNSEPYPYGPLMGEDSILIIDEPYINKNYNMESVLNPATPQPEGRTNSNYGPGIPGQAQLTYPAY